MLRMASRSSPMSPSSRRLTGRIPLSLRSISTRFSHVDCIRSISNFSIFITVLGDKQIFHAQASEVANRNLIRLPRRFGAGFAEHAQFECALSLLPAMLQFSQLLTLLDRIHQDQAGALEDERLELLLAGRVRAHRRDVRASLQIAVVQQGRARTGY